MFQSAREEAAAAIGLLRHGQEGAIETNFLDMPATGAGPEPGVVSLPERRQKWVVLPECAEAVSLEDLERPTLHEQPCDAELASIQILFL